MVAQVVTILTLVRDLGAADGMRVAAQFALRRPAVRFYNRGQSYWIARDPSLVFHLTHSIEPLRRLTEFVRATDTSVYDIGGHSGLFSTFALERAPAATVTVVEPDPELGRVIRRNLRNASRWKLVEAAVGASPGRTTLYLNRASRQTNSIVREAVESFNADIETMDVAVITLEQLLDGQASVDVVKLDVQGAESLVLQAGERVLGRIRTILVEISLLDPSFRSTLTLLEQRFGSPTVVNLVAGGADLAFERQE